MAAACAGDGCVGCGWAGDGWACGGMIRLEFLRRR
jgi:hypothetical protein